MGKAGIKIAVSGNFDGAAFDRAEKRIDAFAKRAAVNAGGLGSKAVELGSKLASAGGSIYSMGQKVEDAGSKLQGMSIAAGLVAAATGASAVKIDTALTGVRKTVDGTAEQYNQLKESAIEFSKTNAVSADQILDIQMLGAQLGFSIDELTEMSRVTSGLSIATDMGAEQAATEMAQFANITKMAHSDVSRYGSAIVNLGNHMATTESKISGMAQNIAAAGKQTNMTVPDILGWSSAMSSLGVEVEKGGTAFSQTIATIDREVALGSEKMEKFAEIAGMSSEKFAQSWKANSTEAFLAILKGAGSAENLTLALDEMGVTSVRQSDVLKRLAGNTDLVTQALEISNQGWNENTALQKEVENRNDSMASKLEILKNKLTAISEDVGTPLVNALTDAIDAAQPLLDTIEEASTAFSGADKGTQQFVLGLGAVAIAASPVLTITGKLIKTTGSFLSFLGKTAQTFGTYENALTTTNAAALEAYSTNTKLNHALNANPAVKAAGGVDQYVSAVKQAAKDTGTYNRAVKRLEYEQSKGNKASAERIANLEKEVVKAKAAKDGSVAVAEGYQTEATNSATSTAMTKLHAGGLMALTAAANIAKAALATIAPLALVAAVTAIVTHFKEAEDKAKALKNATSGLEQAVKGSTNSVRDQSGAFGAAEPSCEEYRSAVEKATDAQSQLADKIREINTETAAQDAEIRNAYATIGHYANQSDLSIDAQNRLKVAVDTINDTCGTQIQVIDAANGKLADENGAITDVTASLGGYIKKKLEQIRIDAQQEKLKGLYKQQADDLEKYMKAQEGFNKALEKTGGHDKYVAELTKKLGGTAGAAKQAEENWKNLNAGLEKQYGVDEARQNLESVGKSIDIANKNMETTASVADSASTSVSALAASNNWLSMVCNSANKNLGDFSNDLANAGVSVDTFKSLNDQQLTDLVGKWDGTTDSIIQALKDMGIEMEDSGLNAANALANGLSNGTVSVESATAILKASASGDWSDVVKQMTDAGIQLPKSVADGIRDGSFAPSGEMDSVLSMIALKLNNGDVTAASEQLGHDIDSGLAEGIKNGKLSESQVQFLGQDVIDAAKTSLDSHSPSRKFEQIGSDIDAGLSLGIGGNADSPMSAISSLGSQLVGGLSGLLPQMQGTGSASSGGLSAGLSAGVSSVISSATRLATGAQGSVSGVSGSLSATGQTAGAGFARGIGSSVGATHSSARALANAASNMGNVSSHEWGKHLGQNFAEGINAARGWVADAARNIANAAKNFLHFTQPDMGPWSGAERGGIRSGMHLAQNFAQGMSEGTGDIVKAAEGLAFAAAPQTKYSSSVPASNNEDLTKLLISLLDEVRMLHGNLGEIISENTDHLDDRDMRRLVNEYVR